MPPLDSPSARPTTQVVSGELSDSLLDQLSALSSEVFLPLLASNRPPALASAPEVVAKGVAEGMQKFVASGAWGVQGQMRGGRAGHG